MARPRSSLSGRAAHIPQGPSHRLRRLRRRGSGTGSWLVLGSSGTGRRTGRGAAGPARSGPAGNLRPGAGQVSCGTRTGEGAMAAEDVAGRFEALYRRHFRAVLRYALAPVEPESARDVTAETFLIAWRRLADVPEDAAPWLFGVARKVIAGQLRSDARRSALCLRLEAAGGGRLVPPTSARRSPGGMSCWRRWPRWARATARCCG
jgi:Sigma-70 region 2